ncbi:MAG: FAD-binding oxidoreductase [Bacteroidia bacterium]|jgi:glycine/D-amino acid oxidase-like deaminating enzyme|nr:FAD-binding oxidoreductase [Bacteroidia bacterium]
MNKDFNYSYWELKSFFQAQDLIVIGAGIVGLSTAIAYKLKNKSALVLVIERGLFPEGASTKNAGFACFGSAGELLEDLKNTANREKVWETVAMRWEGLNILKARLGVKALNYKSHGGFELLANKEELEVVSEHLLELNTTIYERLGIKNCYKKLKEPPSYLHGFKGAVFNKYEGQLDTGKMMTELEAFARKLNIRLLYNIRADAIVDLKTKVEINTSAGVFSAKKCVVATNGFANQLLKLNEIKPARAQVVITGPISELKIKGTFHFDQGYYYFRNIGKRVLFGGGRHLDFKKEETAKFGLNAKLQKELENLLKTKILPNTPFSIDHRWSGIMGVGHEKKPIIRPVSTNVVAAVRMGGMGIAIGSKVGELAAGLID